MTKTWRAAWWLLLPFSVVMLILAGAQLSKVEDVKEDMVLAEREQEKARIAALEPPAIAMDQIIFAPAATPEETLANRREMEHRIAMQEEHRKAAEDQHRWEMEKLERQAAERLQELRYKLWTTVASSVVPALIGLVGSVIGWRTRPS